MVPHMSGSTITLKNIPPELHQSLKELAKRHKRSLNQEAIRCLEEAVAFPKRVLPSLRQAPPPVSVGKILKPLGDRAERQADLLERDT